MVDWVVEVVSGPDVGQRRRVDGELEIGRNTLGRNAGLRLHDRMASRHHARISADGKTIVLEDMGSTNGTLVNNEEVHGLAILAAGDQIRVGVSTLELGRLDQLPDRPTQYLSGPHGVRTNRRLMMAPFGALAVIWFCGMLYFAIAR